MQNGKKRCQKGAKRQKTISTTSKKGKIAKNDAKKGQNTMPKRGKMAKDDAKMQRCASACRSATLPIAPPFLTPTPSRRSPGVEVGQGREGLGGADELVEDADDVGKLGAPAALLLPALHHQLVDGRGTVQRRGEAEALVDGLHHLRGGG